MGKIIIIEGTDGSGKKTQSDLLLKYLCGKYSNVRKQSFPNYESDSSAPIKMYLGGELGSTDTLDAYQASSLFAVDRLCTWQSLKQFYNKDGILVFDRYVQSNMIHQAGKIADETEKQKFLKWIDEYEFSYLKLPRPDEIIFLNMPPDMSIALAHSRSEYKNGQKQDIYEQDSTHLYNAYNTGIAIAKQFGWTIIDCVDNQNRLKSIDEIQNEIRKKINL